MENVRQVEKTWRWIYIIGWVFLWLFFLNRLFKVTWFSVSEKFDCYPKIYKKRFANRFLGKKINITQKIVEFSFVQVKNILLILEILN